MTRPAPRAADTRSLDELSVSELIRTATRTAHEDAETSSFITRLMRGELSIEAWQLNLEQFEYVYEALETVADRFRADGIQTELLDAGLNRLEAIRSDLTQLRQRTGLGPIGVLPATQAYIDVIHDSGGDITRFIAHHYTRYLGDLSGGQVMRVKFREHYELADDEGRFFVFDRIPAGPRFKKRYRELLDALALDADGRARLVGEANESFACNQRIFEELGEHLAKAPRAA